MRIGDPGKVGRLADQVLDAALLGEVERLRAAGDEREGRRRDARLRDVEDLERPARRRARRLVAQRPAEDAVELARRDAPVPVLGDLRRRLEDAARCRGPSSPTSGARARGARRGSATPAPPGSPRPSPSSRSPATSHLLPTRMSPWPASSTYEATFASWPVGPSLASTTSSATSHSSMRLRAWTTDRTSGPCSVLPRRRIPAVSTRRKRRPRGLEARVDRVARRAGDLRDDRALLAEERVDERRLADVRAPDDREGDLVRRAASVSARDSPLPPELVSRSRDRGLQVVDADVVLGRDAVDLGEPELPRLDLALAALLAGRSCWRRRPRSRPASRTIAGGRAVARQDARGGVHDEEDEVRAPDRRDGLVAHGRRDLLLAPRVVAAGVDESGTRGRRAASPRPRGRRASSRAGRGRSTAAAGRAG